jgi:hypothetical protein
VVQDASLIERLVPTDTGRTACPIFLTVIAFAGLALTTSWAFAGCAARPVTVSATAPMKMAETRSFLFPISPTPSCVIAVATTPSQQCCSPPIYWHAALNASRPQVFYFQRTLVTSYSGYSSYSSCRFDHDTISEVHLKGRVVDKWSRVLCRGSMNVRAMILAGTVGVGKTTTALAVQDMGTRSWRSGRDACGRCCP